MASDTTKLTIELQAILKGLSQTLRGLDQIKKKLDSVASVKFTQQSSAATDKAALAAQRLAQQQQRLSIQSQELANRQERVRQVSERLALSSQRLNTAQQQVARSAGIQADAHVRVFKAIERGLAKAPQVDAHVKAFRAIQKGSDDADAHVKAFRANEAALAKAPQLDAHVKAFHATEAAVKAANDRLAGLGNSLRSIGQGLASVGATLSGVITAPLIAIGATSVNAAVELDSLKRGLAAIVGSADEASRQLTRLTQIAKLPGIGFEEAIQGSIRLQAVGFSAKEAEGALRQFSNAIALTGGGRDELNRVTVQLGQLAAKGKVLSQDLRPIIEAAPAVGRALLQAFGTVNADDIQELGLSSKQFLSILVDQLGQLPRAAAGAKNSFENFRDEVFRASAAVGEALLPSLIRLAEAVGPAITKLADAFSRLPQPVQLIAVGVAALLAALGPVVFVVGQLTQGVGRLLVGFVELNAAGILPTIASLRALTAGTLTAAAAQRTLAASSALVFTALGGIAAGVTAAVTAYAIYNTFQKDAVELSKERAQQLIAEIDALEEQAKFLSGLQSGVKRTADEQQRLTQVYDKLNTQAQIRIAGISDEQKRLVVLRAELEKLIQLRGEERVQQAASIAAQIAGSTDSIAANERSRQSITERIAANNSLVETLQREGRFTRETRAQLELLGQSTAVDVAKAIQNLQEQSVRLIARQRELGDDTEETRRKLEGYLESLRALDPRHELTARQLLTLAKNIGAFKGDIEATIPVLDAYIRKTDEATKSTDAFSRALSQQVSDALRAGDAADALAKSRKALIEANAATAREAADSFEGALKFFRAFIAAQPELQRALQREAQIEGKTFDEVVQKSLQAAFKGREKSGTSLRSAQEELAKALAQVALASSEEQVRIEKQKNDQLLQAMEVGQKLQLISYREFLEARAQLAAASVDKEIGLQAEVVRAARTAQLRLTAAAGKPGIPEAEKIRRQAQAAKANEEAIKAEGKLKELTEKREQFQVELRQQIALTQHEQINDIRDLGIELADLQGRIEDAFNADTLGRFREQLIDLGKAQVFVAKRLEEARKKGDADGVARLTRELQLNKEQADTIRLIVQQKDALGALAAAQELVRLAKEKQQRLEEDLAFQVQFRGLKEEDAIKQRLAGEEKLNNSLTLAHETIRQIVADLQARGIEPPRALTEFLKEIQGAVKGLGELSFGEQFQLVEKEFNRLNDERLNKIADIERAVRNRDIAEAEGLLLIRRINGQYSEDLERQVDLLKQIAAQSNDVSLQRQAQQAEQTAKDAAEQLADFNRQLRSASIDALRDSFTDFFASLADRTKTAKEKLLDLVNSVAARINQVIAENLSKKLIESLFGGVSGNEGVFAFLERLFGLGQGKGSIGGAGGVAASGVSQATQATAAATALTTGATAAATALTTGGVSAGTALVTSATAAATAFASTVIAAGAAFAASVAGVGAASGLSQGLGGLGSIIGAATGIFPATPGGAVRIVEGGFPEAVLTTDPKHAARQVAILRAFLQETRGLGGRIRGLAAGGFTDRIDISAPRVSLSNSGIGELAVAGAPSTMKLRQVLVDQRSMGDWVNSSEGEQVFVDFLFKHAPVIRKIGGR